MIAYKFNNRCLHYGKCTYRCLDRVIEVILESLVISKVCVESSVEGSVLLAEESQMPFTDSVGRVSGLLQVFGQYRFLQRQAPGFGFQNYQMLHSCNTERNCNRL